jgi:hypothetical protein
MQATCNPVFPGRQVHLRSTAKPVTPFGGLVSLIEFFHRIGLAGRVSDLMPFRYTSPNAVPPAQTMVAFMISVVVGARRLAHTDWLRADKALHALLGIKRFPGTDTVRNLFKRFGQGQIEAFWRPLWKWLLCLSWPVPAQGFSLDLDSTVFQRSGHQEGARKGYNPARPGRHSHHPLLAFLAEAPLVLHAWLRGGNAGTANGVVSFLSEALALLPDTWKLRTVRADSGFFSDAILSFLEDRRIPYIVVARLTRPLKRKVAGLAGWTSIDGDYAWVRFSLQLHGWSKPRDFFAIRERVRETKAAAGRMLLDVEGYTFRVFATNREGDGVELWRPASKGAIPKAKPGAANLRAVTQLNSIRPRYTKWERPIFRIGRSLPPSVKRHLNAADGLPGVTGDSAQGKRSRVTWEIRGRGIKLAWSIAPTAGSRTAP